MHRSRRLNLCRRCNVKALRSLDSSNKDVSGHFIEIDGDMRRELPKLAESWRWYDNDDSIRIIVDPPNGMADKIKMITLTNNMDVYFTNDDMVLSNYTMTYNQDRFVENCRTAVINAEKWQSLLPDTIHYLRSGCTITAFDEVKTEILN